MKEEREEKIVGKVVIRDECDNLRKNYENEEEQLDKLERYRKEEMSGLFVKEENRGNRVGVKIIIKDDKKQLFVEIDISGKVKEIKSRDYILREN